MATHQTFPSPDPRFWLLSDARNDASLEAALSRLPKGSGFIFRHYHLASGERRTRFEALAAIGRAYGHIIVLSGSASRAHAWGADGIYGAPAKLPEKSDLLRLATAHDEGEIRAANRIGADAVLLSPVFPTRSHPGGAALGPDRFRQLAAIAEMPVIALGGMTQERAIQLGWPRWAAIDGLVSPTDS